MQTVLNEPLRRRHMWERTECVVSPILSPLIWENHLILAHLTSFN